MYKTECTRLRWFSLDDIFVVCAGFADVGPCREKKFRVENFTSRWVASTLDQTTSIWMIRDIPHRRIFGKLNNYLQAIGKNVGTEKTSVLHSKVSK
jgi:hypothetical protein